MKMKNSWRKMILVFMLVLGTTLVSTAISAKAEESTETNSTVTVLDSGAVVQAIEDISQYRTSGAFTAPDAPEEYTDYIFAGWYTDADCKTALKDTVTSENIGDSKSAYAKFVPEDILSVRAQIKAKTVYDTDITNIRFVTSVDSLKYKAVGFDCVLNGQEMSAQSNEVYKKLYAMGVDGKVMNYTPGNVFHSMSTYFLGCTLKNVENIDFGHGIIVKPYWITLDGTKVSGVEDVKTINMGYKASMRSVTTEAVYNISRKGHDCDSECYTNIFDYEYYNCIDETNYSAQGGCLGIGADNKEYYYQALIKGSNTVEDAENDRVYIRKIDMTSGETVAISDDLTLHHANDMTYNPDLKYGDREGLLVVIHNAPVYTRLSFVNPDDLTHINPNDVTDLDGNKMSWAWTVNETDKYIDFSEASIIKKGTYSINYNSLYKKYVVGISGGQTFTFLDANLNELGKVYQPTSTSTNFTTQGNTTDDGYIYFVLYCKKFNSDGAELQYDTHIITVYDWDGNFVTVLQIPNDSIPLTQEPENISIHDNKIYISCANGEYATLYQVNGFTQASTIPEASIVRGDVTYEYVNLEDAMMDAEDGETITIIKENVEVSSLMEMVAEDVILTNEAGLNVTISRGTDYTGSLIDNSAKNFTIKSNTSGSLTFDGTDSNKGDSWICSGAGELHLEELTIQNITVNQGNGGAVSIDGGDATVTNCILQNNQSTGSAGAIYTSTTGTTTMTGLSFYNNKANSNGGAICNYTGTIKVEDCTFGGTDTDGNTLGNTAKNGGAIYNGGNGIVEIVGNDSDVAVFKNNQANGEQYGGGAICLGTGNLNVDGYTFEGNSAFRGGAIAFRGTTAQSTLNNLAFTNNQATTENGGAIHSYKHSWSATDCKFDSNSAFLDGGASYGEEGSVITLTGTKEAVALFETNSSGNGGAVATVGGSVTVTGYTFNNNTAKKVETGTTTTTNEDGTETTTTTYTEALGGAIYVNAATVTAESCAFTENKADVNGGAILSRGSGTVNLTVKENASVDALFEKNSAIGNGGAVCIYSGTLSVDGYTFDANSAAYGGAVRFNNDNITATLKNATFVSNTASNVGGAIHGNFTVKDRPNSVLNLEKCIFGATDKGNSSTKEGGAIYNAGTSVITDTSFTANQAAANGGAIYNGGALTLNGTGKSTSAFSGNKTTGSAEGGAIYHGGSALNATAYIFENNVSAARGGVLCNYGTAPTFTDCKMVGNTSATNGGAIYSGGGNSVYLNVSEEPKLEALVEGNSTTNGYGGAVGMGTGHLYVDGYTFKTNTASSTGGAIYVVGGENSAQIINSVFDSNEAVGETGGAVRNKGAVVTIANSKFASNESKTQDGAIANTDSGKMTISAISTDLGVTKATLATFEGNISNNTEEGYGGGAIYYGSGSMSIDGYAFNNNISKGDAGALCLRGGSTVSNCTFDGNSADRTGGAIWTLVSSNISNSTFTENTAVGTTVTETVDEEEITNYLGGGAILNNGPNTVITGSTFTKNTTEQYGGSIYNTGGITVTEGTFESNVATGRGGAIFNSGATVTVKDTSFKANDGNQGGAIGHQNNDEAVITIEATGSHADKTIFDGNITSWNGGAIRSVGGTINVKGYTFVSHEAPNNGAAIYVDGGTTLNIEDSRFGSATAPNIATANGGAIYGGGDSSLTLTGTTDNAIFEGNKSITTKAESKSGYGGGAICIGSGSLTINGYTFKNNSAIRDGGAITHRGGKLDIDNTSFIGNETTTGEGGAIYRNANSNFTITIDATNGAKFENNQANAEGKSGGAIYLKTGSMTMSGYTFTGNEADKSGGAIYLPSGVTATIEGTSFTGNTATMGGAIECYASTLTATSCNFTSNSVSTDMTDETVREEALTGRGGGAVNLVGNSKATFNGTGTFTSNTAINAWGGAIYTTDAELEISGYTFTENVANQAGAIMIDNVTEIVTADDESTTDTDETVYDELCETEIKVNDSKFVKNESTADGGAIYVNLRKVTLAKTTADAEAVFDGNISQEGAGGAIQMSNLGGILNVSNYTFTNNSAATQGGAIQCHGDEATISSCTFGGEGQGNIAGTNGGAFYAGTQCKTTFNLAETVYTEAKFEENKANTTSHLGGGAICMGTGNLTVDGYTFKNNYAAFTGGAIRHNAAGNTMTITNSVFNGNKSDATGGDGGGAIYNKATLKMSNTSFDGNTAVSYGGAMQHATNKVATIESCKFTNNKSTGKRGGAIYGNAGPTVNLTVKADGATVDSLFQGNTAKDGGGAVCIGSGALNITGYTFDDNSSNLGGAVRLNNSAIPATFTNSVFSNNEASGQGGALFSGYAGTDEIAFTVTNCKFDTNSSALGGGIYVFNGNQKVTLNGGENALFTGNTATTQGGAIYFDNSKNTGSSISGYTFTGNSATERGGAIGLATVTLTMSDSNFNENSSVYGGAIECYASTLKATSCHFTSNTASADMTDETVQETALDGRGGGAVNLVANSKATFDGTGSFTTNTVANGHGGAIYTTDAELEISGYTFTGNTAKRAGAIMIDNVSEVVTEDDEATTDVDETAYDELCETEIKISDSKFVQNSSAEAGGAIQLKTRTLSLAKTSATAETIFDGNTTEDSGGAIQVDSVGGILKVSNYTFINNTASAQGGAIHCHGDEATISSCTFGGDGQGNTAGTNGGAFYAGTQCKTTFNIAETVLTEAKFEGNTATAPNIGGGAICMGSGNLTVEGYTFKNNTSGGTGGAIHHNSAGQTMTITNSGFDTNIAETHGGAIYNKAKNMNVSGSTFTSNNAKVTGAETTNSGGGAIYNATASMQLNNNTFTTNSSGTIGGAVTNYAASPTITDCKFEGNTSTTNGGGLYIGGGHTVTLTTGANSTNAIFKGNSSTEYGGAIGVGSGVLNVTGYTFEGNTATTTGGAIHHAASAGSMTISDSVFNSNESKATGNNGGGAIWNVSTLKISNTSFDGNIAASYGGAIHHATAKVATIESCKFTNNQSTAKRGGAIYGNATPTINVTVKADGATVEPLFQGNYGKDGGGAICIGSGDLNVTGYTFDQNTAQRYGGALRMNNNSSIDVNLTSCIFTANKTTATSGEAKGGAILYDNATADSGRAFNVTNCKFDGNSSFQGGALWINKGAVVAITGTDTNMAIFNGNQATGTSDITTTFGGAIYTLATSTESSVTGYTFTGNSATLKGGAVYVDSGASLTVNGSKFETNTSKDGGAIYNNAATLKVLNPTSAATAVFTGNTSTAWGGAIYTTGGTLELNGYTLSGNKGTYGGAILMFSESTVSSTTFQSNEATTNEGGAIYVNQNATFTDCKFDANTAKTNGGAICVNGSGKTINLVGNASSDLAMFTNNIANNTAKGGGAIYLNAGTLNVNGYTFSGNTPQDIYKNGGTLAGDGAYGTN